MKLLDVNVVLAAHRDDHPDFDTARGWLDQTIAASTPFAVIDLVAGSFLRLATNRRIFSIPTPVDEAFSYLKALRAQPAHVMLAPGPGHIGLLEQLCTSAEASGDIIADAQLAAIALEHACELVSFDRDFARFSELNWRRPLPMQAESSEGDRTGATASAPTRRRTRRRGNGAPGR
ncbi:MAG TPA: type II toxin-antitoxin system VapC family toxin [Solirubrobacteraceae bacterium]|nr:type II toxin-antitoxin system VapC family toxin [Solirubrobacteraceae bacterium]